MHIEIAEMARMSERGSSLLRLIQNSHTPVLDLLIRESVQNSLDAAKKHDSPVYYDISIVEFNKHKAAKHFTGIQDKLISRFSGDIQKSIVIRDKNTVGLTGPLHQDYIKDNKFGNLLKLVYEISMPQEKKEAGGSWGLGKTVYFRAGIGLVIYYSRIKLKDGEYQSRLAACLVEDETKSDTLLPEPEKGLKRGIAWWGEKHSENSTRPITNQEKINRILEDFNIEPYTGDETGTTIIIPFINEKKLIAKAEYSEEQWWHKDIEQYLNIALQRWYAPRINNEFYPYGSYLVPSVNNKLLTENNMEPIFSIIRSLYIAASSDLNNVYSTYIDKKDIQVKQIDIHKTLRDKTAGKVAFIKLDRDNLRMNVPENKRSPYEYLDLPKNGDDTNPPIICYLRKPGMIINYETEGKWTSGIDPTPSDEYIIGVFVPESKNLVIAPEEAMSLDEYLRRGEKADHSSWSDIMIGDKKFTIVERIQKRVSAAIRHAYNSKDERENLFRSGALSKSLAKVLLPPAGFGNQPSPGIKTEKPRSKSRRRNTGHKLEITNSSRAADGSIVLNFEITIPEKTMSLEIEAKIDSEGNKKITGDEWESENEIGTKFPVVIRNITFDSSNELLEIKLFRTKRYGSQNKVKVNMNGFSGRLSGKINLASSDPIIQAVLDETLHIIKEGRN